MGNKIELKRVNGETFQAELVSFFELVNTGKRYVFYTLNEEVENGLVKMYVSEVFDDSISISQKMSDEEWTNLKSLMKSMLKGNANPNIKYLKWEG